MKKRLLLITCYLLFLSDCASDSRSAESDLVSQQKEQLEETVEKIKEDINNTQSEILKKEEEIKDDPSNNLHQEDLQKAKQALLEKEQELKKAEEALEEVNEVTDNTKEESLQAILNWMKEFEKDPDKLKGTKVTRPQGGVSTARYINFTSDKSLASYVRYPDKYMNKISSQEALLLMTHRCSSWPIYPKEAQYIKLSYAVCEEYTNLLGFRSGLQCYCQFTHTQVDTIFYRKPFPADYQGAKVSSWPERYERLIPQE